MPVQNAATFTGVATRPSNLHVVIPASRPDQNLCKVLLSASILGYPAPVIINWNQEFNDPGLVEGGSHLAKISGVHEYLLSLDETHDEDVMLMVDGYDIWLQLRPQTLLDRYFALNRKADRRIREELGEVADKQNIRQEIIFGCQKRCWPWELTDPPCYAVPNSTLPKDIYGADTDTGAFRETSVENPYVNYRQRFLNSGVSTGSVRAMRKLFGQAKELALIEANIGSDQYIFSHIYGDQSVWRENVRREAGSGLADPNKAGWPQEHFDEVRRKADAREDKNFEFGIGVDFGLQRQQAAYKRRLLPLLAALHLGRQALLPHLQLQTSLLRLQTRRLPRLSTGSVQQTKMAQMRQQRKPGRSRAKLSSILRCQRPQATHLACSSRS